MEEAWGEGGLMVKPEQAELRSPGKEEENEES